MQKRVSFRPTSWASAELRTYLVCQQFWSISWLLQFKMSPSSPQHCCLDFHCSQLQGTGGEWVLAEDDQIRSVPYDKTNTTG